MTKPRDLATLGGGFTQSGTGAIQRTVENKLKDTVSVKDFGAVGDGVVNDTAAIQAALAATGNFILRFPPGTYKINSTITLNASQKSLHGDRAVLDFSGNSGNAAIIVTGTAGIPPYRQNQTLLSNLELIGPGITNSGSIGILFNSAAEAGASHTLIESVNVHAFQTGHEFRNNAYIINFLNSDVYNCTTGIYMPSSYSNYGERITYTCCTIYNSTLAARNNNANGAFHFTKCSFDYNAQQVTVNSGRVFLTDCHIEANPYTSSPFTVDNTNGAFLQIKGGWMLCNANTTAVPVFSVGNLGTAQILDVFANAVGANVSWVTGTGKFYIRNISSYTVSDNPLTLRSQDNRLADGGFEDASVFDAFIRDDTSAITSRTAGANINLTTSALEFRTGSKSLRAAKTFGGGSVCGFVIAAPISDINSKSTFNGYYKKPGSGTGTVFLSRLFANVQIINGLPVIAKFLDLGTLTLNFTSSAVDWTLFQTTEPLTVTPSWANYSLVAVNMTGFAGPDSMYFDDFEFFEI